MYRPSILFLDATSGLILNDGWQTVLDEFQAITATGSELPTDILKECNVGCIVIATEEPVVHAAALMDELNLQNAGIPVIVVGSPIGATNAVRLMKLGVHNCLDATASCDDLWQALESALEEKRLADRITAKPFRAPEPWRAILIGNSPAMEEVAETVRLAGPRKCTVLIQGETGTGKEVAARALHMASPRSRFNMVAVNCSALPENLLEAELFGHTRGAFTGAVNHRIGRFEQANKGTLFLDEIGDMPLDMQAKLLRALQDREIQRLGSSETIKVDVRIIAATNVDLLERVRQGRFREDLYYRLNVVSLQMPPLRARPTDIADLALHFVEKVCLAEDIPAKRISPEALRHLSVNGWPGNVRQLENAIEMAVAMSGNRTLLIPSDFSSRSATQARAVALPLCSVVRPPVTRPLGNVDFNGAVARFELEMLHRALNEAKGNKTAAAERLGIKRTTLIMKMRTLESSGISLQAA